MSEIRYASPGEYVPPDLAEPDPDPFGWPEASHRGAEMAQEAAAPAPAADRLDLPELVCLPDLLAEPDEPVSYRIADLLPTGGRVVFAAQYKSGKTTGVVNLAASLADATPFLGSFDVTPLPPRRTVVLIDDEMSRGQLRRWLADQGIEHPERVRVVLLRGRVATFDLLNPAVRAAWAAALRDAGAAVVIFDCLRPVLDALGLDEHRDAGRFLVAFDALLRDARVTEAVVVHHMGHNGERSRGDSRIRDWPDVEWRLVRQAEPGEEADPAAPRYFSAYGRDVDVPEGALTFDPATRRLTLTGGNRRQARTLAALPDVLAALEASGEPLSGRGIEDALKATEHGRQSIREAIRHGIREGSILTEEGPRNAVLHRLNPSSAPVRRSAPRRTGAVESECASAPIGGALHSLGARPTTDERATGALDPTGCASNPADCPNGNCRTFGVCVTTEAAS